MCRPSAYISAIVMILPIFATMAPTAHAAYPDRQPAVAPAGGALALRSRLPFALPGKEEQATLVQETMTTFVRAIARRDMSDLFRDASSAVREQLSPELLLMSFRPFLGASAMLAPAALAPPVITASAASGSEGALSIEGVYALDRYTVRVRAVYVREGLVWRWSNLHVKLLPADGKPGL